MRTLHWEIEELRPLWEHALCAPDWREPHAFAGRREPGLLLVKDLGCYIMSNGDPGWVRPNGAHVVAYSEELGADDRWVTLARCCGADDFVDPLDAAACLRIFSRRGGLLAVRFHSGRRFISVRRGR
jgi:hypothetical protein